MNKFKSVIIIVFFSKLLLSIYLLSLVLFPFFNYKIGIASHIFPSLEIVIIFYLSDKYKIKYLWIFGIGLFIDQLYSMRIGTNSFCLILGNLTLSFINNKFAVRAYLLNFLVFCLYTLLIFCIRFIINNHTSWNMAIILPLIFQYLTTIFSYPIIEMILTKLFAYIKSHK